ncbi:LOW QUALITY PROTEIN: hypothetical protein PHPALM_8094 [Phytophthora palmivora]|uniref:Uncharacterized protein n=1 Tax=Phytophthora palmivora TaxID=4796 RepID=A0A2P4YAN2_9STRA|nr:LOW QUALITY PROTEIN: hypothetical protein PHPALM_8094 [Phytophthora palmivora]
MSSRASDEPHISRSSRKIKVSDAELVHRARSASRASRKGRLLRVPSVMWDCKEISGFAMLSRRTGANGENFEVLTTGEVACDPNELEALLCPRAEGDYNSVAREFFGDQFIYGSIVHEVQPRGFGDDSEVDSEEEEKEEEEVNPDFRLHADDHVAVRTACFSRSRRFARNEEWCFLEHFRSRSVAMASPYDSCGSTNTSTSSINIDDPTGFTVVMSSLSPSELTAGKMTSSRIAQLHGITAAYLVEPLPQTVGCRGSHVRVSFHATYTATENAPKGYADSQTVRKRLKLLAKSLHRLPDLNSDDDKPVTSWLTSPVVPIKSIVQVWELEIRDVWRARSAYVTTRCTGTEVETLPDLHVPRMCFVLVETERRNF